ncbi:CUL4, partial [Symbiodinium microadriaticum]
TDALAQLDTFMKTIFSNIEAKDYFMDAYIGLLSKRLLGGKSVSYDTEKAVVAQMKMQCGTSFTIKVEGMIIDHSLAESIYKKWLENSTVDCKMINFHVQVLTSCYWPKLSSNSLRLSTEMQHCVDSFTDWYLTTNSSRRLRWVHSAGEVVIRATYFPPVGCGSSAVKASPPPSRVYEVCLTTEQ